MPSNQQHSSPYPEVNKSSYRSDIDGLRGLQIIALLGFHGFPTIVTGGYIGVSIFFVISGYLISTILFKAINKGQIDFLDFYLRRIRRIFPALIVILVAAFAIGWFILLPEEFWQLGLYIAGGAAFGDNFVAWHNAGYFDRQAELKPLLHLWSLGIEEQFYLLWPFILWFAWKRKFNLLAVVCLVTITSFFTNIYLIGIDPVADFYAPWTRFWEIISGAVLAYLHLYKKELWLKQRSVINDFLYQLFFDAKRLPSPSFNILNNTYSLLGFCLILYGVFTFTKQTPFPGWYSLIPVMGAIFILAGGEKSWINRNILSNRRMVWLGVISYPLYLWHWMLLSFSRINEGGEPSAWVRAAAIALSILLSWLTYILIENPIRFGQAAKIKASLLVVVLTLIGLLGYNIYTRDGYTFRFKNLNFTQFDKQMRNEPIAVYGSLEEYERKCDFIFSNKIAEQCYVSNPAYKNHVLLWGDSTAQMLAYGLMKNLPNDWQLNQITERGCPVNIYIKIDSSDNSCNRNNYFAMQTIAKNRPDVVVISQVSGWSKENIKAIYDRFQELGIKKTIFVSKPTQWEIDLPSFVFRKMRRPITPRSLVGFDEVFIKKNQQNAAAWNYPNAEFINITDVFCNKAGCLVYIGDDVEKGITSLDKFHLTPIASDYLAKELLVNKIISSPPNKN